MSQSDETEEYVQQRPDSGSFIWMPSGSFLSLKKPDQDCDDLCVSKFLTMTLAQ